MDSGLGAIGRKTMQRFIKESLAFLRLERPGVNVLILGAIFYILGFHFQQNGIGQLVFENGLLRFLVGCFFYAIPALLYRNSSLFKSAQLAKISQSISACLCVIMTFLMLGNLLGIMFGFSGIFSHAKMNPSGQLMGVYERENPGFAPGDSGQCRYLIQQNRVFPGVLRNEVKLGEEVCLLKGNSFPLDLQ
jgi:hypothetical protein